MMEARKASKATVVPVLRGKTADTATATSQLAWLESDKRAPPEPEREPFLSAVRHEGSESSLECERLFDGTAAKGRIFSIELERGDPKPAGAESSTDSSTGGSPATARSNSTSSSTSSSSSRVSSTDDSHSDTKLVDKLRKVNRRRRKTRVAKLLQLCQCCPWAAPWSLLIVSALQISVYIFNNSAIHNKLIFSPANQDEVWRFVTYTFLHAGSVHLVLNIIIQILVAFPLETEQAHGRVLLVYFGGVLAGGLGASVFEPTLMVGASAGVYSLLISHIPHIIMNFQTLSYRYYRLLAVLVLCISDVLYSVRHCLTKGNLQPRIGVAAHISGAICGLLLGFAIYRAKVPPDSTGAIALFRTLRYLATALYVGWIGATVFYNLNRPVM